MPMLRRNTALAAATLALAGSVPFLGAAPAHAAFMPPGGALGDMPTATAAHLCGTGWRLAGTSIQPKVEAIVFRKGNKACMVGVNVPGRRSPTGAVLYVNLHAQSQDMGTYSRYAGPIYATVPAHSIVTAYAYSNNQGAATGYNS